MAADVDLTRRIKECARAAGFDAVGVTRAAPFPEDRRAVEERVAAGHYSGLPWFTAERAAFASDPRNLLPTARSIISLAMSYRPDDGDPPPANAPGAPRGRISAYAWGRDYHTVLKERMERVVADIRAACGPEQQTRTLVDTARILDRAAARRAGVGWVGKHTNVITKAAGSWVFLGEILTELELAEDEPLRTTCGSCDLCLRACPTGAISAPYVVESDRCISYLTIEHRGIIPRELRPLMGDWIFGCDICQEVCPPNRRPGARGIPYAPAHREFRLGATRLPMHTPAPAHIPFPPTGNASDQPAVSTGSAGVPPAVSTGSAGVSPAPVPATTFGTAGVSPAPVATVQIGGVEAHKGDGNAPSAAAPALIPLLDITQEEFARRFGKTPVKRAKRDGLRRNVAIALGNSGDRAAVPALARVLRDGGDAPVVRAHAAWALGRLGGPDAARALRDAREEEGDEVVRAEIAAALRELR